MRARRLRLHPTIGPRADSVKRHAICYAAVALGRARARSLLAEPVNVRGRRSRREKGSIDAVPATAWSSSEGLVDAVNIALQSAFILIFVVVLAHYIRDPRPVHRDLVLVFASVVALFTIAIVTQLVPGIPRAVTQMSGVILLLQPYLTLRLAGHFVRVSRSLSIASLVWFGTAA